MAEAKYDKPTSTKDLEARQKKGWVNPSILQKGVDPVQESENGYVGVDPIYQSFSDPTQKPLHAEGGPEAKIEKAYQADHMDTSVGATPEGESDAEDEDEQAKDETRGAQGGTAPTPPNSPAKPPASNVPPSS